MAGKGGYQRPNEPAAVSGPGKYSKRTDGKPGETPTQAARYLSGGSYGEGQEMMDIQQSAPMAAAPDGEMPSIVPLSQPTMRPDEPVTAGSPFGPGPGPERLNAILPPPADEPDAVAIAVRAAYMRYPSPYLRMMLSRLEAEGR